jgi:hypothetical protein
MSTRLDLNNYFRILWTAVPDGIAGPRDGSPGTWKLRVLVQPRLFDSPAASDRDAITQAVASCFDDWPGAVAELADQRLDLFFYPIGRDGACRESNYTHLGQLRIRLDQDWNASWRTKAWRRITTGPDPSHPDPWINWPSSGVGAAGAATHDEPEARYPTYTRSYPAHRIAHSLRLVNGRQSWSALFGRLPDSRGLVNEIEDDLVHLRWGVGQRHNAPWTAPSVSRGLRDPAISFMDAYLDAVQRAQRPLAGGTAPDLIAIKKNMLDHLTRVGHRDLYRVGHHSPRASLNDSAKDTIVWLSRYLFVSNRANKNDLADQGHFLSVAAFHGRAAYRKARSHAPGVIPAPTQPHDFFQKMSLLQNYPNLLPHLGIVLLAELSETQVNLLREIAAANQGIGGIMVRPVIHGPVGPGQIWRGDVKSIPAVTGFNIDADGSDFRLLDRQDWYRRYGRSPQQDPAHYLVHWIVKGALDFSAQVDKTTGDPWLPSSDTGGPSTPPDRVEPKFRMECLDYDGGALKLINFAQTHQRAAGPTVITSGKDFILKGANDKARAMFDWQNGLEPSFKRYLQDPDGAWELLKRYLVVEYLPPLTSDFRAHRIVENLNITVIPPLSRPLTSDTRAHRIVVYPKATVVPQPDENNQSNSAIAKVTIVVRRARDQYPWSDLENQLLIWHLTPNDAAAPARFEQTPSHRSARISLIAAARDNEVARAKYNSERLEAAWRLQQLHPDRDNPYVLLDSADLILGLVPYVLTNTDQWASLSWRSETYLTDLQMIGTLTGDAPVRLGTTKSSDSPANSPELPSDKGDPKPPADDHAAPRLFRWSGSCLTVPPTKDQVTFHGEYNDERQQNQPAPEQNVVPVTLSVPDRSEPQLRFSRIVNGEPEPLSFHVLVMNRAGGLRKEFPSDAASSNSMCVHLRYEPIPAPVVLLDHAFAANDSPEKGLKKLVVQRDRTDRRWLAPPRADVDLCWTHGMFDVTDFDSIGSFDAVQLDAEGDFQTSGLKDQQADAQVGGAPTDVPLYVRGWAGVNDRFPYYPDPMARRLTFRLEDFRGHVISTLLSPNLKAGFELYRDANWPHARAISIELRAADPGVDVMSVDVEQWVGRLVVRLPPAWRARVALANAPDLSPGSQFGLGVLAVYQDFQRGVAAGDFADLAATRNRRRDTRDQVDIVRQATLAGENPLVSPPVILELVHPVEKPLLTPVINSAQLSQAVPSQTGAILHAAVDIDAKSTGLVEFTAEWHDWVDNPNVSDRPLVDPETAKSNPSFGVAMKQNLTIGSKNWLTLEPNAGKTTFVEDQTSGQHSFPDTRHRFVHYRARAHSSFRSYYSSDDDVEKFLNQSDPVRLEFLNTKNPDLASVAYGVPSFEWMAGQDPRDSKAYRRLRRGGNIRLWLDRGWWSSGEGELLAVVCLQPGQTIPDADGPGRFVTGWGSDPVRYQGVLPQTFGPAARDFAGTVWTETSVQLDSIVDDTGATLNLKVELALYSPQFDLTRRLWYSDIQFKQIPSNYAFVKLALMRYQPHSLSMDVRCSRVVSADFAQLYPDRAVSVVRVPGLKRKVRVHIYGGDPSHDGPRNDPTSCGDFKIAVERLREGAGWPQEPPQQEVRYEQLGPDGHGALERFVVQFPDDPFARYKLSVTETDSVLSDQNITLPYRIVYADVIELSRIGV